MLTSIHPKLPMRDPNVTAAFYTQLLGFSLEADYGHYLILQKDAVELHFFLFESLHPATNYGQIYIRTEDIHVLYEDYLQHGVPIHPNAPLSLKPWDQWEFSILDPDNNLLTFGEAV